MQRYARIALLLLSHTQAVFQDTGVMGVCERVEKCTIQVGLSLSLSSQTCVSMLLEAVNPYVANLTSPHIHRSSSPYCA